MHIGIAADHGGYELKQYVTALLRQAGHDVTDFGADQLDPDDDYPDFVIPLATAVAAGQVDRGIEEVLDLVDLVQIMTVNPDWGGQTFLPSQLDKIRCLQALLKQYGLSIPIAVDGGIDTVTAPLVVAAGATVLVACSHIYNDKAPIEHNVATFPACVT